LIPVDAVQPHVALGQLLPGGVEAIQGQPTPQAPLDSLVAGEAGRQHFPADAGDQQVEQTVQAVAVVLGLTAVAFPDDGREDRLEEGPHVLR
jgi:hypothetical protein